MYHLGRELGRGSLCKPKNLKFILLFDITPTQIDSPRPLPDHRPHIEKKLSLIAFRQILPKHFACGVHFQLHILDLSENA